MTHSCSYILFKKRLPLEFVDCHIALCSNRIIGADTKKFVVIMQIFIILSD